MRKIFAIFDIGHGAPREGFIDVAPAIGDVVMLDGDRQEYVVRGRRWMIRPAIETHACNDNLATQTVALFLAPTD